MLQYKNRIIPLKGYPNSWEYQFLSHYLIPSLFEKVIINLPHSLEKKAKNIYKKIIFLRRRLCFDWDSKEEFLKIYSDILEKRFPKYSEKRENEIDFLYQKFTHSKLKTFLNKSNKKLQKFRKNFPYLYRYLIKPLYDYSSEPLYLFFMAFHYYMLFRLIESENVSHPFFDDIEKTLRITSGTSLEKAWEEGSKKIFIRKN